MSQNVHYVQSAGRLTEIAEINDYHNRRATLKGPCTCNNSKDIPNKLSINRDLLSGVLAGHLSELPFNTFNNRTNNTSSSKLSTSSNNVSQSPFSSAQSRSIFRASNCLRSTAASSPAAATAASSSATTPWLSFRSSSRRWKWNSSARRSYWQTTCQQKINFPANCCLFTVFYC